MKYSNRTVMLSFLDYQAFRLVSIVCKIQKDLPGSPLDYTVCFSSHVSRASKAETRAAENK